MLIQVRKPSSSTRSQELDRACIVKVCTCGFHSSRSPSSSTSRVSPSSTSPSPDQKICRKSPSRSECSTSPPKTHCSRFTEILDPITKTLSFHQLLMRFSAQSWHSTMQRPCSCSERPYRRKSNMESWRDWGSSTFTLTTFPSQHWHSESSSPTQLNKSRLRSRRLRELSMLYCKQTSTVSRPSSRLRVRLRLLSKLVNH